MSYGRYTLLERSLQITYHLGVISALTTEFSSDKEQFPNKDLVNSHSPTDRRSRRGSSVMTGPAAWSRRTLGIHRADGADEFTVISGNCTTSAGSLCPKSMRRRVPTIHEKLSTRVRG
jgi:hypothetical protein